MLDEYGEATPPNRSVSPPPSLHSVAHAHRRQLPISDDDTLDRHTPTFEETLAFAREAEAAGLDSIWVFDHLLFRYPDRPESGLHEAWTTLAALATAVPRAELGSLVMCASFRNPGLLARMAATLDAASGGRVLLGLGSGWHDPEYEAFGYPTDHRIDRFAEDLEVTARLLRGERVTFEGRWRRLDDAVLLPPPTRRLPVLVAARRERMLDLTARWADAWNTAWFGSVDARLRSHLAGLDTACEAIGRDPSTIRRTVGIRLHEAGAGHGDPTGLDADATGLAALFDDLAAVGFDDAIVWAIPKSVGAIDRIAEARRQHLGRTG